jgi:hypothetical protein
MLKLRYCEYTLFQLCALCSARASIPSQVSTAPTGCHPTIAQRRDTIAPAQVASTVRTGSADPATGACSCSHRSCPGPDSQGLPQQPELVGLHVALVRQVLHLGSEHLHFFYQHFLCTEAHKIASYVAIGANTTKSLLFPERGLHSTAYHCNGKVMTHLLRFEVHVQRLVLVLVFIQLRCELLLLHTKSRT